jgi:hypothetical protein
MDKPILVASLSTSDDQSLDATGTCSRCECSLAYKVRAFQEITEYEGKEPTLMCWDCSLNDLEGGLD